MLGGEAENVTKLTSMTKLCLYKSKTKKNNSFSSRNECISMNLRNC